MIDGPKDRLIEHKLRKMYMIALIILVATLILSQIIIQWTLHFSDDDARVINIAGRQRMLSQKISKSALGLYISTDEESKAQYTNELRTSLELWKLSHKGLKYGDKELGLPGTNSDQIIEMFQRIEPHYNAMANAATELIRIVLNEGYNRERIQPAISTIMNHEAEFLHEMDAIVFQYDSESRAKVMQTKWIEVAILIISFIVLWVEIRYIFRPALKHVDKAIEEVKAGKDQLVKEKELLHTTMSSIAVAVLVTDATERITLMNSMAEKYTGWSMEEAYGKNYREVFKNVNIQTREREVDLVRQVMETGSMIETSKSEGLIAKDGTEIRIAGNATGILSQDGSISGVVISVRDISKEFELEKEIESFLEVNLDMLSVSDSDGNFIKVNKRFEEVLGYSTRELEGMPFLSFVHEEDIQATIETNNQLTKGKKVNSFTNRYRCKDGSYRYIEWNAQSEYGKFTYLSARDVTAKKLLEEQLRTLAQQDKLTGVFNRHCLDMMISSRMEYSDRYDDPLSIMILDLDHFKQVNDIWGHPVGDDLLKMTAKIISENIRESDLLFRLGGEEFIVLLPATSLEGGLRAAEKIRLAIDNNSHPIAGKRTVSIGVSQRMKAESYRHWYRRTDEALYRAKQEGRNRVVSSDGNEQLPFASEHLEWKKEWESGNEKIDKQHQEIIDIAKSLVSVAFERKSINEWIPKLELLLDHVNIHFEFEENELKNAGYPDYENHSDIHRHLMNKATWLKEALKREAVRPSAILSFVLDDLVLGHMTNEYTKFFPYIKHDGENNDMRT